MKKTDIKNRLEALLKHLDINQKDFAKLTGLSENTLSNAKNGKNTPTLDFFNSIYTAIPNLNAEWLYMGVGEMFDNYDNTTLKKTIGGKWLKEEDCNEELKMAEKEIKNLKTEIQDKKQIIQLLRTSR